MLRKLILIILHVRVHVHLNMFLKYKMIKAVITVRGVSNYGLDFKIKRQM